MYRILFLLGLCAQTFLSAQEDAMPPPDRSFIQTLVLLAVMGAAMYFILIRPAQKQRKEMENQQNSLKKGIKVVAMGIIGTVDRIEKDSVILKMVDGSKIEVLKRAISEIIPETSSSETTLEVTKGSGKSGD